MFIVISGLLWFACNKLALAFALLMLLLIIELIRNCDSFANRVSFAFSQVW